MSKKPNQGSTALHKKFQNPRLFQARQFVSNQINNWKLPDNEKQQIITHFLIVGASDDQKEIQELTDKLFKKFGIKIDPFEVRSVGRHAIEDLNKQDLELLAKAKIPKDDVKKSVCINLTGNTSQMPCPQSQILG